MENLGDLCPSPANQLLSCLLARSTIPDHQAAMNHCHDCASPLAESETTCRSCGASLEQASDRAITAPSAFINANIRVGPLRFHRLITLVATLATLALIALGGRYGWDADPDAGLAFVEESGTAAAINEAADFDIQIVDIVSTACGVASTQQGLVVGPNIIISPSSQSGQPRAVRVSKPGGDSEQAATSGVVIGLDDAKDMVVIRSDLDPTSKPFIWRTFIGLRTGESVFVVLPGSFLGTQSGPVRTDFVAVEATIDSFRYDNDGVPTSVRLSSERTSSFLPGAAVLDQSLRLVGVIDRTGHSLHTSDVLQPGVSAIVVDPQPPNLVCEQESD